MPPPVEVDIKGQLENYGVSENGLYGHVTAKSPMQQEAV
jgi:hypothetical protein